MNEGHGIKWRFLIVEDKEDIVRQLKEMIAGCVDAPDNADADVCETFQKAADRLRWERFDVLILDLKDDSDEDISDDADPAGIKVFEELKKTRFVPVVFYTALAHKVRSEQTSFVRVVEKTDSVMKVRDEIRKILATRVPELTRQVEEFHRSYMWDFVTAHWKQFSEPRDQADIAYLLARRLAISLNRQAVKLADVVGGGVGEEAKAHPMRMYVAPPLASHRMAGDVVREKQGESENYWLVITPSCDFAQCKAEHVVLAKCEKLTDIAEYKAWALSHPGPASRSVHEALEKVIVNNRKGQQERFKFLPGTFFLPDLLVDFQQLRSMSAADVDSLEPVAALDSPFAEAVLGGFTRYFGRLGTPDIDKALVLQRLQVSLKAKTLSASTPTTEQTSPIAQGN